MLTKYTYSISGDFPNQKVSSARLTSEIQDSDILTALDYINTSNDDCDIWFKVELSSEDSTSLDSIIMSHSGEFIPIVESPRDADNKPIVRSDSRPIGTETYFTAAGDDQEIGDGQPVFWDFGNSDNIVDSTSEIEVGYKMKRYKMSFADPIWLKEGTIYFHGTHKKSYVGLYIVCPQGNYYLDRNGSPHLASEDTKLVRYVNRHFFAGDCPMGDELNTEGCAVNALPSNYELWIEVSVPEADNASYGWVGLELYRSRSFLLPGEDL